MIATAFSYIRHRIAALAGRKQVRRVLGDYLDQVHTHTSTEIGEWIERVRQQKRQSGELIEIRDFGAGYGGNAEPVISKRLKEVVQSSARGRKEGEWLYRLCKYFQPQVCLELGTNLGFSTLYQLAGLEAVIPGKYRFITIEGAPELAKRASIHFQDFGFHPEVLVGEFSEVLKELLKDPELQFDYVLIDGNHRYEPVMKYVRTLLPRMREGGILIVDDIRWSEGMERAWEEIREIEPLTVCLDLFFTGVCFLRNGQPKTHLVL